MTTSSSRCMRWVSKAVERAAAGEFVRGESGYFRADGAEHIVDVAFMPIKDESGMSFSSSPAAWISPNLRGNTTPPSKTRRRASPIHQRSGLDQGQRGSGPSSATRHSNCAPVPEVIHPDIVRPSGHRTRARWEDRQLRRREIYPRKDRATVWVRSSVIAARRSDGRSTILSACSKTFPSANLPNRNYARARSG